MPFIFDWKDIKPEELVYEELRENSSQGSSVPVKVRGKDGQLERFVFLGPEMRIPFGLKCNENKYGKRFTCDMTFPNVFTSESGEYVGPEEQLQYLKWLLSIENNNINKACESSEKWFKKQFDANLLKEFYFKSVMDCTQPQKYSPTYTTRIQTRRGDESFVTKFFDKTGKEITFEQVRAGSRVRPLIETTGLWFANKSFGMSFRLAQLMVLDDNSTFDGCAIPLPQPMGLDIPLSPVAPGFNLKA